MNKFLPNSFQIPNAIIDNFIQKLSGNELKIYLIIVRKTKGWNKEYDGISHSQFIKFSGIVSRNTVSKSLKILTELNLIKELKRDGTFSLFYLADPYQKMSMSKNEHVDSVPQPKNEHDPHQELSIQTDITKEEEKRRGFKLSNFEKFYAWLPKENIKIDKWHKKTIRKNLLNDEERTLDNFKDFLDEQESIKPEEEMIDIAKEQFKFLCVFVDSKTPNQILKLDREQTYQEYFEQPTNNFIERKRGLVELSSSLENPNYHTGLLQELTKEYLDTSQHKEQVS